ncbi:17901_t:CDS:2 [Racocetra persica]|uniref:17901_t:CDS:1 n=1 Tax=Racocetra persica TaxID=160502 RepID=A0ACA9N4K6_9GLOM|nr:17901_t:CDS:2 [Racocetra persica]
MARGRQSVGSSPSLNSFCPMRMLQDIAFVQVEPPNWLHEEYSLLGLFPGFFGGSVRHAWYGKACWCFILVSSMRVASCYVLSVFVVSSLIDDFLHAYCTVTYVSQIGQRLSFVEFIISDAQSVELCVFVLGSWIVMNVELSVLLKLSPLSKHEYGMIQWFSEVELSRGQSGESLDTGQADPLLLSHWLLQASCSYHLVIPSYVFLTSATIFRIAVACWSKAGSLPNISELLL